MALVRAIFLLTSLGAASALLTRTGKLGVIAKPSHAAPVSPKASNGSLVWYMFPNGSAEIDQVHCLPLAHGALLPQLLLDRRS